MCQDMRRFERMAEEKKRAKKEEDVSFALDQPIEARVVSRTKSHKRL